MGIWSSLSRWASRAWRSLSGGPGGLGGRFASIWHFITNVGQIIDWVVSHPFTALVLELRALAAVLTLNGAALNSANARLNAYIFATQTGPTRSWVMRLVMGLRHLIWDLNGEVIQFIRTQISATRRYASRLTDTEARARRRAVRHAEALARRDARRVLQTVQRQAASAYAAAMPDRLGVIRQLLDLAVSRDPLVRDIAARAAAIVLDAFRLDSLPERLVAGFLIRQLVDRLGFEKPIGRLVDDLLAPILGDPRPADLHGVILDVGMRLNAVEAWQANVMAHGGPELLQAGSEWQHLDSAAVDVALVAFAAAALAEPARTAADLSDLTRVAGDNVIREVAALMTRG